MLLLIMPLLLVWIGVKTVMPVWYFIILGVAFFADMIHTAYRVGKGKEE